MDLALNNLQRLICHKTNQTNKQSYPDNEIRNADCTEDFKIELKYFRKCSHYRL